MIPVSPFYCVSWFTPITAQWWFFSLPVLFFFPTVNPLFLIYFSLYLFCPPPPSFRSFCLTVCLWLKGKPGHMIGTLHSDRFFLLTFQPDLYSPLIPLCCAYLFFSWVFSPLTGLHVFIGTFSRVVSLSAPHWGRFSIGIDLSVQSPFKSLIIEISCKKKKKGKSFFFFKILFLFLFFSENPVPTYYQCIDLTLTKDWFHSKMQYYFSNKKTLLLILGNYRIFVVRMLRSFLRNFHFIFLMFSLHRRN